MENNKLGISDDDEQKLINETEILYHVAADVRFDENLTDAILANARGDFA
jgi:hypothetical protein